MCAYILSLSHHLYSTSKEHTHTKHLSVHTNFKGRGRPVVNVVADGPHSRMLCDFLVVTSMTQTHDQQRNNTHLETQDIWLHKECMVSYMQGLTLRCERPGVCHECPKIIDTCEKSCLHTNIITCLSERLTTVKNKKDQATGSWLFSVKNVTCLMGQPQISLNLPRAIK